MVDNSTVKSRIEIEADMEAAKARARTFEKAKRSGAVEEGFKAHTKGEKLFNDLTYTGLGYFGVTSFSVFMTWLFRDTKYFGPKFAEAAEKVSTWMSKGSTPTAKQITETQSWLRVGALFTGGSLMTVTGVKALEDNKAKIVKHFDKQIYGEDAVKNDPEIYYAHQLIEAQPKQTWSSVGWSRVVAFVATISSLFLIGSNSSFIGKHLNTSFDTLGLQFGRWGGRMVNKFKGNTKVVENIDAAIAENKMNENLGSNLRDVVPGKDTQLVKTLSDFGADGLYTVITAVGLFVFTRILAPVFDKAGFEKWSQHEEQTRDHKREHKDYNTGATNTPPLDATALESEVPRVKVDNVESAGRVEHASKHVGVPA